ncbi:MAG: YfhO family protein [Lachnospiraceae bacterium]
MKTFFKKNWNYVACILIPLFLILLHGITRHIWFTGDGSILVGDGMVQLLPVFHELWNKVHSGAGLSYTWNIGGGLDFYGVLGYTVSPFTLLILLFPKDQIVNVLQVIMVAKWVLASFTMTLFFEKTKYNTLTGNKKLVSLFLGLGYSLSNGVVYYMGFPQLVDPLICFPILLLLVEKMFDEKKWKLYYFVLSFCIITNVYTSYMICLFLCMWFIFLYEKQYKKERKKIFLRFAGSSLLAAVTGFVSIYQLLDIGSSRLAQDSTESERLHYMMKVIVTPRQFLEQFFALKPLAKAYEIVPNVYISVIAVSLIPFLFFIHIKKSRKIKLVIITVLLALSVNLGSLSLVWHGFTVPNGVYHRHIFIIIFIFLFIILHVFENLSQLTKKRIVIVGLIEFALFVWVFLGIQTYATFWMYLITILLLAISMMLLFLFCKGSITYKQIVTTLSVMGILELTICGYFALGYYQGDSYNDLARYGTEELLNKEMEPEPGERMVSLYAYNYGAVFDRPSGQGFVSGINQNNLVFHDSLGLGVHGHVEYSELGGSPLINLIYNNRYGISYHENSFSDVELVTSKEGVSLYRMKRLAGLGYMVDSDLVNWDVYAGDCFDAQNDFVQLAVDGKPFFKRVDVDLETKDVQGEGLMYAKTEDKEYYVYSTTKYSSIYDSIQVEFEADHDMDLYTYMIGDYNMNDYYYYYIYINGELIEENNRSCACETIHIGEIKKGQKVTIVRMPTMGSKIDNETTWGLVFEEFDDEAYSESYEKLAKNTYDIEVFEDDYVKGSIHADEDGLMMTSILADDNFIVYVDGEAVEYETVADTMIGVPLTAGDHVVEFKYESDVMKKGLIGSLVGVLLFGICCLIGKEHKPAMDMVEETEVTEMENSEDVNEKEDKAEEKGM